MTCPHRPAPVNGIYIQDVGKTVWLPGDIARYRCNPDYVLFGHSYTDCRADGTWQFDVPTCRRKSNLFGTVYTIISNASPLFSYSGGSVLEKREGVEKK